MINLVWKYEITSENRAIAVSVNGLTAEVLEMPLGEYYGFYDMTVRRLLSAVLNALQTHSLLYGGDTHWDIGEETSPLITTSSFPRQWLNTKGTALTDVTIEWTNAGSTADPFVFGFENADISFTPYDTSNVVIQPQFNPGYHFTPRIGYDNAEVISNLSIAGSQAHAASVSDERGFATRVLGESYKGSLIYDVVPAGFVKIYLNTFPNSYFSQQAGRDPNDPNNNVEQVLRAASENVTFEILADGDKISEVKIPPPWDIEAVSSKFSSSGVYYSVTFPIQVLS